jgi:hypothetical protein
MENVELETAAIKFALISFADFENEEDNRIKHLKDNFGLVPSLKIYSRFNEEKLQSILLEKEQQRTGDKLLYLNSFDLYSFHSNLKAG